MSAIITDYAVRRVVNHPEFYDISAHDHMRFMTPFGDGFQILDSAGFLYREYNDDFHDWNGQPYTITTTIKFTPDPRAFTAFKNLSGDEMFIGGFQEFVCRLVDYAKLWREAIYQVGIYPYDPWLFNSLSDRTFYFDGQYIKPALEDIIRWASDDREFERLHELTKETGIDSSVEALREGVPLEDILA